MSSQNTLHDGESCHPADIQVTLHLRRRSVVDDHETSHKRLTHCELEEAHGATTADIQAVEAFAAEHHLSIGAIHPGGRFMVLRGKLAAMVAAFGADLQHLQAGEKSLRILKNPLSIPKQLEAVVIGVLGFDERPVAKTNHKVRATAAEPGHYTPKQLAQIYNFPAATGKGQTIALIELGGGFNSGDLQKYWSALGQSNVTVNAVSVDGAQNSPSGDPNSADGEVVLDIEVAGGVAPDAKIAVYFAPNTDQGFLNAINAAIHDTVRKPSVLSISWGSPEDQWSVQALDAFNAAFHDAALLGITVLAAAGDNGSTDGDASGKHVDFPASSPWVLSCGGTRLTASGTGIQQETVWNNGTNGGATGGGVSAHFSQPAYQSHLHIPKPGGTANKTGRGVPDVAGVADPETGYAVLIDGQETVIGGTSAVAPLWAALITLCNEELGRNLGWLHHALYGSVSQNRGFRDITSGTNGAYKAGIGWDCCTGLGSPDGKAILKALQK